MSETMQATTQRGHHTDHHKSTGGCGVFQRQSSIEWASCDVFCVELEFHEVILYAALGQHAEYKDLLCDRYCHIPFSGPVFQVQTGISSALVAQRSSDLSSTVKGVYEFPVTAM